MVGKFRLDGVGNIKVLDSVFSVATSWMQGDLGRATGWGFVHPSANPSGSFPVQGSVPEVGTRPETRRYPVAGS